MLPGQGTNASQYLSVLENRALFYDEWANDQDFALYFALTMF